MTSIFNFHLYALDDLELYFVNQVHGISIRLESICDSTQSEVDRGVQCSRYGPELFSPKVPTGFSRCDDNTFNFSDVTVVDGCLLRMQYPEVYAHNDYKEHKWNKVKKKFQKMPLMLYVDG